MDHGSDGKAMQDELTRIKRDIEACERGDYGEGPLWLYLLGWADWQMEKRRVLKHIDMKATT
jgi:hypothetical protein